MNNWKKCKKKPIVVEYREVEEPNEKIHTLENEKEGTLVAYPDKDYIIRGTEGEIYPIKKQIFEKSYDIIEEKLKGEWE